MMGSAVPGKVILSNIRKATVQTRRSVPPWFLLRLLVFGSWLLFLLGFLDNGQ